MDKLIFIGFLLTLSFQATANTVEPTECTSANETHSLTMTAAIKNVELRFEENQTVAIEPIGRKPAYLVSGKSVTYRVLHGIVLTDLMRKPDLIVTTLVGIMGSRPEFDGDADLHYSYAKDYLSNMNCR